MTTYRYRILGWDDNFETSVTRKLRRPQWISVPTKQSGKGFTRIMCQEDGAAIFGLWILIVEACSALPPPRAGWLTDDGTAAGVPWTIEDLVEKWRRKPAEIARALDVLCSPKVGWMEAIEDGGGLVVGSPAVEVREKSGQGGAGPAIPPPRASQPEDIRAENRRAVRGRLARLRLASDDTALEEWLGLIELEAKCATLAECLDCLSWLKFHGPREGVTSRYATHYEALAHRWNARRQKLAAEAAP